MGADAGFAVAPPSMGADGGFVVAPPSLADGAPFVVTGPGDFGAAAADPWAGQSVDGAMSIADLLYPVPGFRHIPPADAAAVPLWADVRFLFEARLVPLAAHVLPMYPYKWCDRLAAELAPWKDRVLTVQDALRIATNDILTACADARIGMVPLKGIDALLWEGGRVGTVHTRDVDLLIRPEARAEVEARLAAMGFAQVDMLDCETGRARLVPDDKRRSTEEGRYEYWPWTRYVPLLSLDAEVDCSRPGTRRARDPELTLRDVTWPLSVVNGHVMIGIEVDLHHSVWPSIPYDRLELGYCTYGLHTFGRMMIADQLVTTTTKVIAELMGGKRSALGAVAYVLHLIRAYGSAALTAQCARRAAELGLADEWVSAVAMLTAMLGRRVADDPRFPALSDPGIVDGARAVAAASFMAALCTDM